MAEPVEYDFDPRNLPSELLAAIGLGMACANQTTHMLESAIWGCLGIDSEYGLAVTTHMPNPLRFHVLKAAAEIRIDDPKHLNELDTLLDNLEKALNKRNEFAHQSWARDPTTGAIFTVKDTARGSVSSELIPQSVNKIEREATAIYDAGLALFSFLIRLDLVPDLPSGKPRAHKTKAARKKARIQL